MTKKDLDVMGVALFGDVFLIFDLNCKVLLLTFAYVDIAKKVLNYYVHSLDKAD